MLEKFSRIAAWILLPAATILLGSALAQNKRPAPADANRPTSQNLAPQNIALQNIALQNVSTSTATPTPEQMQQLKERVVASLHQNDSMLQQYERTEHQRVMAHGKGLSNKDTLSVIIPTGAGEARVELERDGKASAAPARQQQWRSVAKSLSANSHPDDPEVKREYEQEEKRRRERTQMIDDLAKAFRFEYVGRETVGGRTLLKSNFEPVDGFHSSVRYSSLWKHVHGTIWVDESNAQVVRITGELFDDVNIVAGLVVKVYRGSSMTMEQSEVEPGVWFPTHANVDLTGRLFLLPANYHEELEDSTFQRVGPPEEALQKIFHGNLDDPPQ